MKVNQSHTHIMNQSFNEILWNEKIMIRSNIQNVHFAHCDFKKVNFNRSSLVNLRVENGVFENCQFQNVDLYFCKFSNCKFINCDFRLAEISNTTFFSCELQNVNLTATRVANNHFLSSDLIKIDLTGSSTKFNTFINTTLYDSIFGNCTIDYNITQNCTFINTIINVEALGSVWGLKKSNLENNTFLSLGQQVIEELDTICTNTKKYFQTKGLVLELFVYRISFCNENIINTSEQLIFDLQRRYKTGNLLSPDELTYFYEVLKTMRKELMLPLLVMRQILNFFKELRHTLDTEDMYFEQMLLFYNNICLIYNSMLKEVASYQFDSVTDKLYHVKMTFNQKPTQDIATAMDEIYRYVYQKEPPVKTQIISEKTGSYIVIIATCLATLAAFNIGTLLLTGGVKNLVKLRASLEVLFSKKLPRKYYLDVYEPDESLSMAKQILNLVYTKTTANLPSNLRKLASDGINAQNLVEITEDNNSENMP